MVGVVCAKRLDLYAVEQARVPIRHLRPQRQQPVELLQLADPDRGLHVGPAVVEPEPHMVEPRAPAVVAALVAHAPQELPLLLGVREDDSALTGRELLVRVEAEHARNAVRADRIALVLGAQGLGGVLDQGQPVPVADRPDLVELARVAEHVDCHDRLRALGDRRLEGRRVEVQRARVDVGEDRRRPLDDEAVRRGHERERRGDRLVSRAKPGDSREEVQPRGAARDRCGEGRADALGDQLLEAFDRRAEREPPRAQHLDDELFLTLVEKRARERYLPRAGAQASAGAGVA